ncbi:alpha/beta hydrolase [uncultured Legionella sp.]|uniref:alpha/beta fold hydrolase n=1 Tax=uncultured Legionella sp. TaxID=210934 RepID=UPI0026051529|nr:alpha/beta hydrolase [uncultured Legionella sp.]
MLGANKELTEEHYLNVCDGTMFVKIFKPKNKQYVEPIILLHDSLGCVELWRDFPYVLSEKTGRNVIAYDRLGFGKSSVRHERPSINFINEEAELYFPELVKHLSLNQCYLFGHSVGGAMALVCAALYPNRVIGVITESAQAFVEDRTKEGILKAKKDFERHELFKKIEQYHGEKAKWVLDAWTEVWLSKEFAPWSLSDILPHVFCNLLVIHGDLDEYGSNRFPDMISDQAAGRAEKIIIPGCGHVPHRENKNLIIELINTFLNHYDDLIQ